MRLLRAVLWDEEAATAVEYAVLLDLIIAVVISAITTLGANTNTVWGGIETKTLNAGMGK